MYVCAHHITQPDGTPADVALMGLLWHCGSPPASAIMMLSLKSIINTFVFTLLPNEL